MKRERLMRRPPFVSSLLIAVLLTLFVSALPATADSGAADFEITDLVHFYTQTRGDKPAGYGFAIKDTDDCLCFSQFNALGGVGALGYPASQPYRDGPFTYQVMQRALLQWNRDTKAMSFSNVFDMLNAAGKDEWLENFKQVPPSFDWSSDQGRPFSGAGSITENHLNTIFKPQSGDSATMIAARQALEEKFLFNAEWLNHYGFPMAIKDYGHVVVVRAQRAAFQYWTQDVPWAAAGMVTIVLGGDLAKEAGLIPSAAAAPIPSAEAESSEAIRSSSAPAPSQAATPAQPAAPTQSAEPNMPQAAQVKADWLGVNDGWTGTGFLAQSGAGWSRSVIFWSDTERTDGDLSRVTGCPVISEAMKTTNVKFMGLLINTPSFAATNPADGVRSVPDMAKWARFVQTVARECKGLIDHWAIWNEVEIPPTGANARYSTFSGNAAAYYQLLKTAYVAAKQGNPNAKIIVSPYSYHRDLQEGGEQTLPWFEAFQAAIRADPDAAANGGFFDAFALNIYRNAHDLYDRFLGAPADSMPTIRPPDEIGFRERLANIGLSGKPIWLTEFNAMPYDDTQVADWNPDATAPQVQPLGLRITMDEQASFVVQALTLARLAGYERIFFHALVDDHPTVDELWGLVRHHSDLQNTDPTRQRPAYGAFQTVARLLGDATPRGLEVLKRSQHPIDRPAQYTPRYTWHVQAGIFERNIAGGLQRSTVLWNSANEPITILLPKLGVHGWLVSKDGSTQIIRPVSIDGREFWSVPLEAASRRFDFFIGEQNYGDPAGYYFVGGTPVFLVEEGVPVDSALSAPVARDTP